MFLVSKLGSMMYEESVLFHRFEILTIITIITQYNDLYTLRRMDVFKIHDPI